MSFTYASVMQMKKMLVNLDGWLKKGAAAAQKKPFDANVLCGSRLAPDQYPLVRQVQSACDSAKFCAARLSGKEAPKHPDTEQTMDELHARIHVVVEYLGSFKESDFAEADERPVTLAFAEGKKMAGKHYLVEMALPNFFFHVTHAYAILRHNGVDVGKMDYIGEITFS